MMRVDSACVFWRCSDRIVFRLYFRLVLIWAIYSRLSCKAVPGHLGKKKKDKKKGNLRVVFITFWHWVCWELPYLWQPYVHLTLSLTSLFLGDSLLLPEAMES